MRRIFAICIPLAFTMLACSGDGVLDSGDEAIGEAAAKRGGQPKIAVCHWDEDVEVFKLIQVAAPAQAAHMAHGDEVPGGVVLDEYCEPLPAGEITVALPGGVTMDFVWIEPGVFTMGTTEEQEQLMRNKGLWDNWHENEHPGHQVTITRGFWLGKYEITQEQWAAVMGSSPWSGQVHVQANPDHPAVYISWDDVQELIDRLNADAALYRLPTEAEWEYACRSGGSTLWSHGDDEGQLGDYAWYRNNAWNAGLEHGLPVGMKMPNDWGLFDMQGNVWEWVQDWYGPYSSVEQVDPQGPATGSRRVFRGGAINTVPQDTRPAIHSYDVPSLGYYSLGARLVRIE